MMNVIKKYSVIQDSNHQFYRVLLINVPNDYIVAIQMEVNSINIVKMPLAETIEHIEDGTIRYGSEISNGFIGSLEDLSKSERRTYDKRVSVIRYLEENFEEEDLYIRKYRGRVIKKLMDEFRLGKTSVYRTIRLYLQAGRRNIGLVPRYSLCGAPGVDRLGGEKPGAKTRASTRASDETPIKKAKLNGVKSDDYQRDIMNKVLKKYYFSGHDMKMAEVRKIMASDYYPKGTHDYEIPSLRQLRLQAKRLMKTDYPEYLEKRYGTKKFNLEKRALMSDTFEKGRFPGTRYEIDASIPNIQLVDETREHNIGTPIVYLVIDTFTKMVVGMHVGLDSASWNTASSALVNCIEDKVEYAKRFGMDIDESDWITTGLPMNLIADNGEFKGHLPEDMVDILKINLQNTPSGRPDLKPNVERYFKLFEDKISGYVPGFRIEPVKRGDRDNQKDAIMTIKEATRLFISTAIFFNNHVFEGYRATEDMIRSGIRFTPNEIWRWASENMGNDTVDIPRDEVVYALMRRATASITKKGVKFGKAFYSNEVMRVEGWFERAREEGVTRIPIKFDDRDMNKIYYQDPETKVMHELEMTYASMDVYGDKSFAELMELEELRKDVLEASKDWENENQTKFLANIRAVVKDARQSSRGANVRIPNKEEKRQHRQVEAEKHRQAHVIGETETKQVHIPAFEEESLTPEELRNRRIMEELYEEEVNA